MNFMVRDFLLVSFLLAEYRKQFNIYDFISFVVSSFPRKKALVENSFYGRATRIQLLFVFTNGPETPAALVKLVPFFFCQASR